MTNKIFHLRLDAVIVDDEDQLTNFLESMKDNSFYVVCHENYSHKNKRPCKDHYHMLFDTSLVKNTVIGRMKEILPKVLETTRDQKCLQDIGQKIKNGVDYTLEKGLAYLCKGRSRGDYMIKFKKGYDDDDIIGFNNAYWDLAETIAEKSEKKNIDELYKYLDYRRPHYVKGNNLDHCQLFRCIFDFYEGSNSGLIVRRYEQVLYKLNPDYAFERLMEKTQKFSPELMGGVPCPVVRKNPLASLEKGSRTPLPPVLSAFKSEK